MTSRLSRNHDMNFAYQRAVLGKADFQKYVLGKSRLQARYALEAHYQMHTITYICRELDLKGYSKSKKKFERIDLILDWCDDFGMLNEPGHQERREAHRQEIDECTNSNAYNELYSFFERCFVCNAQHLQNAEGIIAERQKAIIRNIRDQWKNILGFVKEENDDDFANYSDNETVYDARVNFIKNSYSFEELRDFFVDFGVRDESLQHLTHEDLASLLEFVVHGTDIKDDEAVEIPDTQEVRALPAIAQNNSEHTEQTVSSRDISKHIIIGFAGNFSTDRKNAFTEKIRSDICAHFTQQEDSLQTITVQATETSEQDSSLDTETVDLRTLDYMSELQHTFKYLPKNKKAAWLREHEADIDSIRAKKGFGPIRDDPNFRQYFRAKAVLPELNPCPICGSKHKPFLKKCSQNNSSYATHAFNGGEFACREYFRLRCRDCHHEVTATFRRTGGGLEVIKREQEEAKAELFEKWNSGNPDIFRIDPDFDPMLNNTQRAKDEGSIIELDRITLPNDDRRFAVLGVRHDKGYFILVEINHLDRMIGAVAILWCSQLRIQERYYKDEAIRNNEELIRQELGKHEPQFFNVECSKKQRIVHHNFCSDEQIRLAHDIKRNMDKINAGKERSLSDPSALAELYPSMQDISNLAAELGYILNVPGINPDEEYKIFCQYMFYVVVYIARDFKEPEVPAFDWEHLESTIGIDCFNFWLRIKAEHAQKNNGLRIKRCDSPEKLHALLETGDYSTLKALNRTWSQRRMPKSHLIAKYILSVFPDYKPAADTLNQPFLTELYDLQRRFLLDDSCLAPYKNALRDNRKVIDGLDTEELIVTALMSISVQGIVLQGDHDRITLDGGFSLEDNEQNRRIFAEMYAQNMIARRARRAQNQAAKTSKSKALTLGDKVEKLTRKISQSSGTPKPAEKSTRRPSKNAPRQPEITKEYILSFSSAQELLELFDTLPKAKLSDIADMLSIRLSNLKGIGTKAKLAGYLSKTIIIRKNGGGFKPQVVAPATTTKSQPAPAVTACSHNNRRAVTPRMEGQQYLIPFED